MNFTIGGFRINRQNVVVQELNPVTGLLEARPEGAQLVQGFEVDLTYSVTPSLGLTLSYGYVDSKITDFGAQTQAVGRSAARISPQNGGFTMRYTRREGVLKGLSANLGITYQDETPTDGPGAGDTYSTAGVFVRSTDQWAIKVPAYTLVNVGVRYTFKVNASSRMKHTVGVNVSNAFDKEYLNPNRLLGDGRTIFGSYALTF